MSAKPYSDLDQLFKDYNIQIETLPHSLQGLIEKFKTCLRLTNETNNETQGNYATILLNTSAIISAEIIKIHGDKPAKVDQDKLMLLALEAKARARKLKLNSK